ncbi:MAG: LacI family DNA-binding transcriptional regulator [Spirochaetales bacterium]|nr:LacI family DNA-binding transcriptional regulator [Spirochaetales bacterium]
MTVNEIAKASGVSTATVSRVLNNGPVRKETREKVEEAIRKLNHMPDDLTKRTLGTQQKAFAIVTQSVTNYYAMEFAETAIDRCEAEGTIVYLNRSDRYDSQYKCISDLLSRGVEGIILHDLSVKEFEPDFLSTLSQRIPLVLVHSYEDFYGMNSVMVDQAAGMRRAARYLLDGGYTKQLFIRGNTGYSFDLKEKVWKEELCDRGITPEEDDVLTLADVNVEKGIELTYEAVSRILATGKKPSAIFTCNDIMGVGALYAVRHFGYRVPDEIAILSHDNTIMAVSNRLSSVDMKISSVAHAALDLMDYAINGTDTEPRKILITPDIVQRDTTLRQNQ